MIAKENLKQRVAEDNAALVQSLEMQERHPAAGQNAQKRKGLENRYDEAYKFQNYRSGSMGALPQFGGDVHEPQGIPTTTVKNLLNPAAFEDKDGLMRGPQLANTMLPPRVPVP